MNPHIWEFPQNATICLSLYWTKMKKHEKKVNNKGYHTPHRYKG